MAALPPPPQAPLLPPRSSVHQSTEVQGFVLWMASFVALALYLAWALVPESALHGAGISYYPDKRWALALPAYLLITMLAVPIVYASCNLANTLPLDDMRSIRDGVTRKQQRQHQQAQEESKRRVATPSAAVSRDPVDDAYSIGEIVDIPIERVNEILHRRRGRTIARPAESLAR